MKVKVIVEHQLFRPGNDLELGPVARKGDVLEVVGTTTHKVGGRTYPYYLVEVDGVRYTSWPPHSDKVND